MFKKKRMVIYVALAGLVYVALHHGIYIALGCLFTGVVLLGTLKLFRVAQAMMGLKQLAGIEQYRYDALIRSLPKEVPADHSWNFAVMGDTRNNVPVAREIYRKIHAWEPLMAFHTGDIVRSGMAAELVNKHIRVIEEEMPSPPLFCIPGNHERGPRRDFAAFKLLYGSDQFAFSFDDCTFVGINNNTHRGVNDTHLAFLESHLSAASRHRFVFIHIPPAFFEASFVSDARRRGFKNNAEAFHEIMARNKVDEVFMAHIHGYATMIRDGVRYTLTAGGGAPLSRRITPEDRHFHFIQCNISPAGIRRTLMIFAGGSWTSKTIE